MVQRYNILARHTNQYPYLCSHAWSVEVSHGKIWVRREFGIIIGEEKLNIGEIRSKDGNGCYYDLNGNKFDSPKSGVNILKLETWSSNKSCNKVDHVIKSNHKDT